VLAGILALLSLVVGLVGVDGDFETLSEEASVLAAGADVADYIRWSFWLNMLGNYLLVIPLALLLYGWLAADDRPAARLFTAGGCVYLLLGAAGSAILAEAWPQLMEKYAVADEAGRSVILADFELVNAIAGDGLHGIVQNVAGAVWLLGIGAMMRHRSRLLGLAAMAIGVFLVLNSIGNVLGIEALSLIGVTATVLLAPLWFITLGIRISTRPRQHAETS
jgi:hypothetical protein